VLSNLRKCVLETVNKVWGRDERSVMTVVWDGVCLRTAKSVEKGALDLVSGLIPSKDSRSPTRDLNPVPPYGKQERYPLCSV
jgi:hypothetical protein